MSAVIVLAIYAVKKVGGMDALIAGVIEAFRQRDGCAFRPAGEGDA